ncbi:hypothetical protein ER57_02945 [Smithella sp. SCADC]|nr:hypothetical protein ER57_02945 [Smithella sp. SCADC]HAR49012.1 DUF456 domain-containing protein [Smithella sp.]
MSIFATVGFTVFILILFAGIFLNLFGLPGTVVVFFDVLFYAIFTGFDHIGLKIILFLLIFTIIAETIDLFFVIGGAFQPVASKKSFGAAALGAMVGIFLLTPFWGGPGIWIGFFFGGLAGTLIIEFIHQSNLKAPFRMPGRVIFAMIGGKMFKGIIALSMIAFSLSNIYS